MKTTIKAVLALTFALMNISAHSLVLDPGEDPCAVYLDDDDGEAYTACVMQRKRTS
ncbi:hypothetical protein LRH25_15630 [Ideonella azotifigens]|uniref:Uncharacterized protein n=1 Tax=Ideonella azotifigens TaxID=513160 RepID=A0ABN1K1N4_9BURK|nr:hypothetical protein [Ideonella azotifigens]MCD2341775.1 hypothetical protein [Ideonella azotifigens]